MSAAELLFAFIKAMVPENLHGEIMAELVRILTRQVEELGEDWRL